MHSSFSSLSPVGLSKATFMLTISSSKLVEPVIILDMISVVEDSASVSDKCALLVCAEENHYYTSLPLHIFVIEARGFEFHPSKKTLFVTSSTGEGITVYPTMIYIAAFSMLLISIIWLRLIEMTYIS